MANPAYPSYPTQGKRHLTQINLYSGIPFDPTFKNVVWFGSTENVQKYLHENQRKYNMLQFKVSYQNLLKPIRLPLMSAHDPSSDDDTMVPFNALLDYNYVEIIQTEVGPDIDVNRNSDRVFFGFITNYEYLNDGTAYVYFSLDLFNTYGYKVDFSNAYIEKGMVRDYKPREDNKPLEFTDEFKDIMNNTVDIGGDGATNLVSTDLAYFIKWKSSDGTDSYVEDGSVKFILFTLQPKDAKKSDGSFNAIYSQNRYAFLAYSSYGSIDNRKGIVYSIATRDGSVVFNANNLTVADAFKKLSTNPDLVGTSSLVVDAELYNYIGIDYVVDGKTNTLIMDVENKGVDPAGLTLQPLSATDINVLVQISNTTERDFKGQISAPSLFGSYHSTDIIGAMMTIISETYPNPFGGLYPAKLFGFPFTKIVVTNGRGTSGSYDFLNFDMKKIAGGITLTRYGGVTENGQEVYVVNDYLKTGRVNPIDLKLIVNHENAMMIDDTPRDVPLYLDNYTEFLNANKNQLRVNRANAKMNERLTKQGANITYSNTKRTLDTAEKQQAYTQDRSVSYNTVMGAVNGAMTGVRSFLNGNGIIRPLLSGIVNAGVGAAEGYYGTKYKNETAMNAANMGREAKRRNAATNRAYATRVATNNYEMFIRSQNAMMADVANHNDEIAHQGSSIAFDAQNDNLTMHIQLFACQPTIMLNALVYFKLFGYTINRVGNIRDYMFKCRKYSYVKTSNANIKGTVNEATRAFFNDLFNNGVTIWQPNHVQDFIDMNIKDNGFI